jgi:hypothetical protein
MQRFQYECHDIESSLCTKLLRASRKPPRSRRTDDSCNEFARLSPAPGPEITAAVAFIQKELEQRFMIGETGFAILVEWMSASG